MSGAFSVTLPKDPGTAVEAYLLRVQIGDRPRLLRFVPDRAFSLEGFKFSDPEFTADDHEEVTVELYELGRPRTATANSELVIEFIE